MNSSHIYFIFAIAFLLRSTNGFGVAPTSPAQRQRSTSLSYSEHHTITNPAIAVTPDLAIQPSFKKRLQTAPYIKPTVNTKTASKGPSHVLKVLDMKEFEQVVAEEKDQIVVVRFYASWCRACKAITPSYLKFSAGLDASSGKNIKFVDCPMTVNNKEMFQTLGIKAIPFAQVYHPETGLAEERNLSRRNYPTFEKIVRSYVQGSCELDVQTIEDDRKYASNPWGVKAKPKARGVSL